MTMCKHDKIECYIIRGLSDIPVFLICVFFFISYKAIYKNCVQDIEQQLPDQASTVYNFDWPSSGLVSYDLHLHLFIVKLQCALSTVVVQNYVMDHMNNKKMNDRTFTN